MPFNARTNAGSFDIDPNKFTDDCRMKKPLVEKVKYGGLISAIIGIVALAALAAFVWFILTV